ncbi:hypothetical protein PV11_09186 [Exophiala sideris]|uniref:Uncharacterized protein n=1 Tax=Exophiala sideris TaxID=1016849 RepID=A0A0D1Y9B1_9EURO|nr:hypothetical protein PV11_09186 [Exophiala sideris]
MVLVRTLHDSHTIVGRDATDGALTQAFPNHCNAPTRDLAEHAELPTPGSDHADVQVKCVEEIAAVQRSRIAMIPCTISINGIRTKNAPDFEGKLGILLGILNF